MIFTNERIVDPVAFMEANPDIVNHFEPAAPYYHPVIEETNGVIVSGPDIDMLVSNETPQHTKSFRKETEPSPVLGPLYRDGHVGRYLLGDGYINIAWYPSPRYVNNLLEQLELRPGEDVLKFAHAPGHDEIPGPVYAAYLQRGEFPQSAGEVPRDFDHDRGGAHAPGVILAPKNFTVRAITTALLYDQRRRGPITPSETENPVANFDRASEKLSYIQHQLGNWGLKDTYSDHNTDLHLFNVSLDVLYQYLTGDSVIYTADHYNRNPPGAAQRVGETIFDHIHELMPRIEALQTELAR